MAKWLDTRGRSTLGIGLCQRCHRKFSLDDLLEDPDTGLRVCSEDLDGSDPYLLPPRGEDRIDLPFTSPEVNIALTGDEEDPEPIIPEEPEEPEEESGLWDDFLIWDDTDIWSE
jgi:hypothetical protein